MISSFTSFIEEKALIPDSGTILLAVSGGMDSMAMAELFYRTGYQFAMVHCNFKLRGKEADTDEEFVKQAAEKYGVECYTKSFKTTEIAMDSGDSIQMTARDLRYGFFEEVADQYAYDRIATAHHLDDQIETFFINLMRGCGISGLHGIPIKKEKIIRPMMFAYRKDIEQFVNDNNLEYREDQSNQSVKYLRNKIRHELMPLFLQMNPTFPAEMSANIKRLAETEEIFRQYLALKKEEVMATDEEVVSIDTNKLSMLIPQPTFLYEFIAEFGFKKEDVSNIIQALEGIPGKKFLSQTHQLLIDRQKILISTLESKTDHEEYEIHQDTRAVEFPIQLRIDVLPAENYFIPKESNIAALDLDKLSFPLHLRKWKEGDAFIPLGMKQHKKLSDYFIDEKFSLLEKDKVWVLCSGDDIVWIVDHRISDDYKITTKTRMIYQVRH